MKKCILVLGCFLLLHAGVNAQISKREHVLKLDSGKAIHFINMTDINGNKIKASSLSRKTVVLNFWFIGCPPCRYEIPQLSKIAGDYKNDKDIVFIAISTDSIREIKSFLNNTTFNYRLIANGEKLNKYYGVETCPLSLIINRAGTIIYNSYTERLVAAVPDHIRDILKNE